MLGHLVLGPKMAQNSVTDLGLLKNGFSPISRVEDPYEVTASVLQEFWRNCNRKTAPSFAYSKRVTIPEIRDESKKHP